ncbi:MAG: pyridoxamine 5'-phosphate oxidase family protein [Pseudomonadota bacterium]
MNNYAELMFTEAVAALQKEADTDWRFRDSYKHRTKDKLGISERKFIESRRSFYVASLSENGWPYVQHRGGDVGFVKVTGPTQIACADYRGNQQFITQGNLRTQKRVSVFMIDYVQKTRLKLQGHATLTAIADAEKDVVDLLDLSPPAERVLVIDVVALDWNCPKYIPDYYPPEVVVNAVKQAVVPLQEEIASLKARLSDQSD